MTTPNYNEAPADAYNAAPSQEYAHEIDASAYYNAPVAPEAKHVAPEPAHTAESNAVVDPAPVLAAAGPEFNDTEVEGVDVASMPAFKDMRRALPSVRLKVQMSAAKVATGMPDYLKDKDAPVNLNELSADDLDRLTEVVTTVEGVVLDNAADRDAMTNWLIDQGDPMTAVMVAFTRFSESLGN